MRKIQFLLFFSILTLLIAGNSHATVITFDDVPGAIESSNLNRIEDGYYGFNWENVYVLHESYSSGPGYKAGVVSGEWVAYNAWDRIATVDDSLFDFNGAYLTSAWDEDNVITVKGFLDGQEKYSSEITLNTSGPVWLDADFMGIDELTFDTAGYHFAMDNFTVNEPVPEPATIVLLILGIAGFAGLRRKKG